MQHALPLLQQLILCHAIHLAFRCCALKATESKEALRVLTVGQAGLSWPRCAPFGATNCRSLLFSKSIKTL